MYLGDSEVAAIWHPPSDRILVPGVRHLKRSLQPLPPELIHSDGIPLGIHRERGRDVIVRLPRADLDAGGAVVLGRRGSGKTTLALQINRFLLAERDQPFIALFDPNNYAVDDLATRAIPRNRECHVALLELGDVEHPPSLSLFKRPSGVSEDAMDEITYALLRSIFSDGWSASRMADLVFGLTVLLCRTQGSLLDAARILRDGAYRRAALSQVSRGSAVHEFWADYESTSEANQREWARPVMHRLRSLYRSPAIRNMLCQSQGLDLGDQLRNHGILLVSSAGQSIASGADQLIDVVLNRLHLALAPRLEQPRVAHPPCYITIDESGRFQGASLPILWREGRKLRSTVIAISQDVHAWGEELAQGALGNTGSLIVFRAGADSARRLRQGVSPFSPEDVEALDRYEAIVRIQVNGATMPAVDIRTAALDVPPDEDALGRIRAASRAKHTRPRREVEAELNGANSGTNPTQWLHDIDED